MNRRTLTRGILLFTFLRFSNFRSAEESNPDPTKNIKLPSGEWLNVGKNWKVENIERFNNTVVGYFDRKYGMFVIFDRYTEKTLKQTLREMEGVKGFNDGIVYSNGTDRFGILAIRNI